MSSEGCKKGAVSSEKRRLVEELHAPVRRNFPRRRFIVRGYDDLWQADLVEMRPYSRFNRGYHYILTVIDVLSKYAWAVPLKSKGGSETAATIAQIIRESKRCPKNLQTYMGKEFYNTDVQRLTRKQDINYYSTYSVLKASVTERFYRTLKKTLCGRCLPSMGLTSGSTRYPNSSRSITPESIEQLACDPLT
ncbi:uncharacterized protein LOC113563443 [Ooceraea biroi]|uniref:uncharacterized protein LOC113563443 n=1 Tax=Ooceraea biroi TaxID=2015173 RepID=UPI000F08B520|nr:uncharacterized protein LOC113563443 [Ooceraea biroi]